jgi:non-ribosomal peptide synthetase component E (peptide arylation enzyme)
MTFSAQNISAMTAAAAKRFGDQVAIVDGDTRLSFAELFEEVRTFGAGWSPLTSSRATGCRSGPSTASSW